MDTYVNYINDAIQYWPVALAVVAFVIGLVAVLLVLRAVLNRRFLISRDMIWLEITPPVSITKTPEATEQLFSVLHGTRAARHLKERLLNRSPVMSFEIVSTRKGGVRYLVHVEASRSHSLQKTITSYVPDSRVQEVSHISADIDSVTEFRESSHYVLPITLTSIVEQHDPLSYITGAMTNLSDEEEVTLQIVTMPIRLREADSLSHKILGNENILQQVNSGDIANFGKATNIFGKISSGFTDLIGEIYMGMTSGHKEYHSARTKDVQQQQQLHAAKDDRPSRVLSAFELELMETMHQKVTRPLFQVNLRLLVKSPDIKMHVAALRSALDGYSVPPYQSLKAKHSLPVINKLRHRAAVNRLPSLRQKSAIILASTELASLYHFPSSQVSKTDNLIASLSRTLPAPVSLKQTDIFDVVIGKNVHHNTETLIGLLGQERERHQYIIGGTGNGKTTLLQYQIVQDMQKGQGLAIIDPHGDMAETILRHVPPDRVKDVIYFNPDDLEYPVGLNLLELTPGLEGNELLREKDIITESVVSVFRKIFSDEDTGGHRIEYILRNTVQTALTQTDATLFTVFDLLNDPRYRKSVTKTLEDKNLVNFWKNEIGKAGDMQKVKMAAGITAKIGRFLFSASARQILEQPKSTIDFDDIINSGKILVCNFSKGLLGEDTSELFGITVLAKLQLASLRRARIAQSERRAFYLYVDEFQNFATTSFVQMLSESRKYRVFMIMAEQSTSQQSDQQMVNIILANVGTVLSFRTGNPQDEQKLLPLFSPYIGQGEISNLPAFNFYAKLSAVKAQEPLSGQTLLLESQGSSKIRNAIVEYSRSSFAKKQEKAEKTEEPQSSETTAVKKRRQSRGVIKPSPDKESMIDDL